MRLMSFFLTTPQFKARTKSVTRRLGWWNLSPGDEVMGVVKCQGLGKGGKVETLGPIRIISVDRQPLRDITWQDCKKEGFPEMTPVDFVAMFMRVHKLTDIDTIVNRIEFEYI
jgi:hypothetical protein